MWTETRLRNTGIIPKYDFAPDGMRLSAFVADNANAETPVTQLTFLPNFSDELRRNAPTGKQPQLRAASRIFIKLCSGSGFVG